MCMYVANWNNCGSTPTLYSNNPAILRWYQWNRGVERATLEIRKVDNAWSQTTCFNLGATLPESGPVFENNSEHNLSSMDYDSLYIARLLWMDSNGTNYYNKDGDCLFTLQPREWVFTYNIIWYIYPVYASGMATTNHQHCMVN